MVISLGSLISIKRKTNIFEQIKYNLVLMGPGRNQFLFIEVVFAVNSLTAGGRTCLKNY